MYQFDISAREFTGRGREATVQRVDYDTGQYRHYARGRAFSAAQLQAWITAFGAVLPARRPLAGLDVGSGTGRLTPALAGAFGPVTGIEPAAKMRAVALEQPPRPGVRYLAGAAEDLPVPAASADYALLFLSWHHVQDKARAARELARAVRPGGHLLLRANFSDNHPEPWWLGHFPRGLETDLAMFQPLHEVIATFTAAGWRVASFGTVTQPGDGTRAEVLARLRLRTLSFFAQLSDEDAEAGLASIERAVAAGPLAPDPALQEPLLALQRR